jgi:hypothetical protein
LCLLAVFLVSFGVAHFADLCLSCAHDPHTIERGLDPVGNAGRHDLIERDCLNQPERTPRYCLSMNIFQDPSKKFWGLYFQRVRQSIWRQGQRKEHFL